MSHYGNYPFDFPSLLNNISYYYVFFILSIYIKAKLQRKEGHNYYVPEKDCVIGPFTRRDIWTIIFFAIWIPIAFLISAFFEMPKLTDSQRETPLLATLVVCGIVGYGVISAIIDRKKKK